MHSLSHEVGEPLYELPPDLKPLDAARGSILVLDWRALQKQNLYDKYVAQVDPGHQRLLAVTAGSWVELEELAAHYRALDALKLAPEEIRRVGVTVGDGVHGAFLATLLRLAGQLGVTPWPALEQCYKLWVRSWRGGGITVHRLGERRAYVTLVKTPVCASRFFRESFAGALSAGITPFCRVPTVDVLPQGSHDCTRFQLTWSS